MRKILAAVLLALLIYGISQNPGTSADTVAALGNKAGKALAGIGTFLHQVVT